MKKLSIEMVRSGIQTTVSLLDNAELHELPFTPALRAIRKLRFGEHFPSNWVDLFPMAPAEVMQISMGELQELEKSGAGIEHLMLVTFWNGRFRALPARQLRFQGNFPALIPISSFTEPLAEQVEDVLGLSK